MSSVPTGTEEGSETLSNIGEIGGQGFSLAEVSGSNSNDIRRQAWNRPVNDVAETALVMGADSWPSLSETTNAPQRPSSNNFRSFSEGSMSLSSRGYSSRNHVAHSVRPNSTQNGTQRGRHHFTRSHTPRSSVGYSERQHPPSSQGLVPEVSSNNGSHNNNNHLEAGQNNGPRPHMHSVNNHHQHRDSHRRSSIGPRPHGDGSLGRRRNVDHGGPDARAGSFQPPVFPGPLPRTARPVAPFLPPPPPFPAMQFMARGIHPITGQPVFYGPPMIGPLPMRPHPLYHPLGPQLIIADLVKQIDYYFSEDSLVKDVYLRRNMDDQGWVPVSTIVNFDKVKDITSQAKQFPGHHDIDAQQFILNVMQNSYIVEVQGDKLRRRNNWEKYILPNIIKSSFSAVETPADEELIARLRNTVLLEEKPILSDSELKVEDKATNDQAEQ